MTNETAIPMNQFSSGTALLTPIANEGRCADPRPRASTAQTPAKLLASQFDRQLAAGVVPAPDSALAVHASRLVSAAQRRELAETMGNLIVWACAARLSERISGDWTDVSSAADLIDRIRVRLCDVYAVKARGVAQLRLLLSDAAEPLYRNHPSVQNAELLAVLHFL
jgi:hypothetical protein